VTDLAQITIAQLRAFVLDVEQSPVTRRHPGRVEQVKLAQFGRHSIVRRQPMFG
jgi:hypothetical protein